VEFEEARPLDPARIEERLVETGSDALAVVHCETTSGVMNPVPALGAVAHRHGALFVVDSMSAFGAVPLDVVAAHIDFMISSANKAMGGVPGFAFVLARRAALEAARGRARTLSLRKGNHA
jgi:2-aminoethylphosphonate-pyruvate transaminase